jgi:hypothetical protein
VYVQDGDVPRGATALVHRWGVSPTIADPDQEGSTNGNACDTTVNKDNESCAAPRGGFLSIPECNSEPCQRSSVTMSTRFANGANSKGFDTEALQLWLLHCCQGVRITDLHRTICIQWILIFALVSVIAVWHKHSTELHCNH